MKQLFFKTIENFSFLKNSFYQLDLRESVLLFCDEQRRI